MKLIKIPRNIFQTWATINISDDLKTLTDTWRNINPGYAYFLYNDNDCKKFILKHFDEKIYNAYCKIIPGAFKADLWRYCVLYVYGGIYVDIDTICLNEIDSFLNEDTEFMTPIDINYWIPYKYNLFNTFIASVPKHPILLDCINRIVFNIENNIVHVSNLDFSGPGVLGRSTNVYLNLDEETSFIGKEGMHDEGKICLLNFEYKTEYVKNNDDNILLQNKNGCEIIQQIYLKELQNINYIDWSNCKNPIATSTNTN